MDCVIFWPKKTKWGVVFAIEGDKCVIQLLMEEILHRLIGSLSKCL